MPSAPSPKQSGGERLRDWYPYYAGFPSDFVGDALTRHFPSVNSILDPWNGSGTTTAVAAARGLGAVGLDINPAVTIVARARLTPVSIKESFDPLADEILRAAEIDAPKAFDVEPLARWLGGSSVEMVRRIQRAINTVLVADPDLEADLAADPGGRSSSLPLLATFYYTALFATGRDLLAPFRASNPTWLRYPPTYRHRLNPAPGAITVSFRERVQYLADRLTIASKAGAESPVLRTASAVDLRDENAYDGCFTSPPYATRVDYVRGSLAELSILGASDEQVADLRRRTTGTPTVRGVERKYCELSSSMANDIAIQIQDHVSHGSANYYGPWIRNYFSDLETSLSRIARAVKPDGVIGIVVQDSHYKSIPIDLQTIVTEAMAGEGRVLTCREDYEVRHSFARLNPAARKHLATRTNHESLLVFT
jgi:SAM-dependent methyltransferase